MASKITNRLEYIKQWAEDREKERKDINKLKTNVGFIQADKDEANYFTTDFDSIIRDIGIQKPNHRK